MDLIRNEYSDQIYVEPHQLIKFRKNHSPAKMKSNQKQQKQILFFKTLIILRVSLAKRISISLLDLNIFLLKSSKNGQAILSILTNQMNQNLINFNYKQMLQLSCSQINQCPTMFHCEQEICVHDDVFPVSTYTIFIYVFMGLAAAFCNVSGNSMGIFKILILMLLLSYQLDEATGLAQAMVVGTAFPNFISIILKKHPNGLTSLVNYKLLALIIPCCLLGSVVGSLAQTLIPKIAQFSFLVIIYSFFVYTFIQKLRNIKDPKVQQQRELESTLIEYPNIVQDPQMEQISHQKQQLLNYQASYHLKQILLSIGVFIVFQVLSFLVQGKLPFYRIDKCSLNFPLGLCALFGVTLIYLFFVRRIINRIYRQYRKHEIKQQIYLDGKREFFCIISGAFAAGTMQGILGMGCGTFIMMVFLSFPINSTVASATSGYQILFTGTGSLLQYYINGQVKTIQSFWMMAVCCLIGGSVTILFYQMLKGFNQVKVNQFLFVIILCLCIMSIGLTGPTIKTIVDQQGWAGMTSISFKC